MFRVDAQAQVIPLEEITETNNGAGKPGRSDGITLPSAGRQPRRGGSIRKTITVKSLILAQDER